MVATHGARHTLHDRNSPLTWPMVNPDPTDGQRDLSLNSRSRDESRCPCAFVRPLATAYTFREGELGR